MLTTDTAPPASASQAPWHAQPAAEVCAALCTDGQGLSAEEAARRLSADGPNTLTEAAPIRPLALLAAQFKSLFGGHLARSGRGLVGHGRAPGRARDPGDRAP